MSEGPDAKARPKKPPAPTGKAGPGAALPGTPSSTPSSPPSAASPAAPAAASPTASPTTQGDQPAAANPFKKKAPPALPTRTEAPAVRLTPPTPTGGPPTLGLPTPGGSGAPSPFFVPPASGNAAPPLPKVAATAAPVAAKPAPAPAPAAGGGPPPKPVPPPRAAVPATPPPRVPATPPPRTLPAPPGGAAAGASTGQPVKPALPPPPTAGTPRPLSGAPVGAAGAASAPWNANVMAVPSKPKTEAIMEGYLGKKGQMRHNWKQRWFVFNDGLLMYYEDVRNDGKPFGEALGVMVLRPTFSAKAERAEFGEYRFVLTTPERSLVLRADTELVRDQWLKAFEANGATAAVPGLKEEKKKSRLSMMLDRLPSASGGDKGDKGQKAAVAAVVDMNALHEGFLDKKGMQLRHNWKRRWCVLSPKTITYFEGPPGAGNVYPEAKGVFHFHPTVPPSEAFGVRFEHTYEGEFRFRIVTPQHTLLLRATSDEHRRQWIEKLVFLSACILEPVTMEDATNPLTPPAPTRSLIKMRENVRQRFARASSTAMPEFDGPMDVVIKTGFLGKKGQMRHSWKDRWFVLKPIALLYFENAPRSNNPADAGEPKGFILLSGAVTVQKEDSQGEYRFTIITAARSLQVRAESPAVREEWLKLLAENGAQVLGQAEVTKRSANDSFGVDLVTLAARSPSVTAAAAGGEEDEDEDGEEDDEDALPAVISNCLRYLRETAPAVPGIFRLSAVASDVQELKSVLNQDPNFDFAEDERFCDPILVACTFKQLFRELPEPLFTFDLYDMFIAAMKIPDHNTKLQSTYNLLRRLPPVHFDVLKNLLSLLMEIAAEAETNKMKMSNLAICWAPNLLRAKSDSLDVLADLNFQNTCVETLGLYFDYFFAS